jgi:hypothetical protein
LARNGRHPDPLLPRSELSIEVAGQQCTDFRQFVRGP